MNKNIYESVAELVCLAGVFVGGILFGVGITLERQAREEDRKEQEDIND